MRAPLSWIRDFTPVEAPPAEIADALNQLGLEVEAIDEPGREINGVVVGARSSTSCRIPTPTASGSPTSTSATARCASCAARRTSKPAWSCRSRRSARCLPGDFKIERRKIRGVVSEGMLCSARELGLGDDHDGILELPADAPLGTDVREVLGLDDVVFDLSITPNRPDAMGIIGVARELAAHFGLPFTVPEHRTRRAIVDAIGGATRGRRGARSLPAVRRAASRASTMGESPEWMQRRLALAGMRPISNVVDVTNYVMLERCRPLHAFDLGRLAGRGIVVRLAAAGEKMDDARRCRAHADCRRPPDLRRRAACRRASPGIMGGAEAEVSDDTTEILLESAYFEASGIAATSKRLGLRSEASARFERGVDPNGTRQRRGARDGAASPRSRPARPGPRRDRRVPAADRAPAHHGAHRAGQPAARHRARRTERAGRCSQPLGIEIDRRRRRTVRRRCGPTSSARSTSSRRSRGGSGSQRIRARCRRARRRSAASRVAQRERRTRRRRARRRRVRRGVHPAAARAGRPANAGVAHRRGHRGREPAARRGVDPAARAAARALLRAVAHNAAHGDPDVALFESGRVFAPPRDGGIRCPAERLHLAPPVRTRSRRASPHEPDRAVDGLRHRPRSLDALAQELRLADFRLVAADAAPASTRRAPRAVVVDGAPVGVGRRGRARGRRGARRCPRPGRAFEIDVDALLAAAGRRAARRAPVSRFPASAIDLAFVVADARSRGCGAARRSRRGRRARSRRSRCSTCSAPTRSVPADVSLAFAFGSARPTARSPTPRSASCGNAVHRRGGVGARAPSSADEPHAARRSRIGSASGTRRSTARVWCSTRTG